MVTILLNLRIALYPKTCANLELADPFFRTPLLPSRDMAGIFGQKRMRGLFGKVRAFHKRLT
jgi:hypothetical protein